MSNDTTRDTDLGDLAIEPLRMRVILFLADGNYTGAKNGVTSDEIAEALELPPGSDHLVLEAVEALRQEGTLVLTTPDGRHFIAATREEWREFRDRVLRPQAKALVSTSRAMSETAGRVWSPAPFLDRLIKSRGDDD